MLARSLSKEMKTWVRFDVGPHPIQHLQGTHKYKKYFPI